MATLSGNKIKDTYQSLIKLTDNGNLTTGAKQLTDGFGNNSPLYISTTQIGIGVTPEATYDLHVYQNAKVGGNLTITGDLTVNGTTTTVDTDTLRVEDPLIEVARNNTSSDAVDIGIYGKYAPSGTTLYAGLFRDTGDNKFKLFRNLEEQPTTTVNTSGTGYTKAGLVIGGLEATTGDFSGDLTVNKGSGIGYIYLGGSSGTYANSLIDSAHNLEINAGSQSTNGIVYIRQNSTTVASFGSTIISFSPNASTVLRINTSEVNFFQDAVFGNDIKALFGGSSDLQIYHSATGDSYIANNTGDLIINSSGITGTAIKDEDNMASDSASHLATQQSIKAYVDSKFAETDTLAEVLALGNTTGGTDISVSAGDDIIFTDTSKAIFGGDLEIYNTGSSFITQASGDLSIINYSDDNDVKIQCDDGSGGVTTYIKADGSSGAVELNHYGTKKFETASTGALITGDLYSGSTLAENSVGVYLLNTPEVRIKSSTEDGTPQLTIYNNNTTNDSIQFSIANNLGDNEIKAQRGNLRLYSSNTLALTLDTSQNATFAGDVTVTGGDLTLGTDAIASNINAVGDVLVLKVDSDENSGGSPNMQFKVGASTELTINGTTSTFAGNIQSNGTFIELDSASDALLIIDRAATSNVARLSWRNAGSEFFRAGIETTNNDLWSLLHTCGNGLYFDGGAMTYGFNTSDATSINSASGIGTVVVGAGGSSSEGVTIYTGSSTYGALNFADATSGGGAYAGYIKFNHSDNSFGHYIGNVERFVIASNGSIYNTTSNPTYENTYYGHDAGRSITSGTSNTFLGSEAGEDVTTGAANTFVGAIAGYETTVGSHNTALGYFAFKSNVSGGSNVALGSNSLKNNTSGIRNIAIGYDALASYTTGQSAIAIGFNAGYSLVSATGQIAIGQDALYTNSGGVTNTAIGHRSLTNATGNYNTAFGYETGLNQTTSSSNTWIGLQAGYHNTTGSNNVAIGESAGFRFTTGSNNVGIGRSVGSANNVTGDNNTMVGNSAGQYMNTGTRNSLFGGQAGIGITTGSYNTILGYNAGSTQTDASYVTAVGDYALANNTGSYNTAIGQGASQFNSSGTNNTAVGQAALQYNTTGVYNTAIGSNTGDAITTGSRNTLMGYTAGGAITTANDNVVIGSAAGANLSTGNDNTIVGKDTGNAVTNGQYNSLFGKEAGLRITGGNQHVCIGYLAGQSLTTGNYDVLVGAGSGNSHTGTGMTAVGFNSGYGRTSSSYDTYIGYQSGYGSGTGQTNVGVGFRTLYNNDSGNDNVAVGYSALQNQSTGVANTAIGRSAGLNLTTGVASIFIGTYAGISITTADNNLAIGYNALRNNQTAGVNIAIGRDSMYSNTGGVYNTVVGYQAHYYNTTNSHNSMFGLYAGHQAKGSGNTYLGSGAGFGQAASTGSNNVLVGYNAGYSAGSGSDNTYVGEGAGINTSSGYQNTSTGRRSLENITTGAANIALGYYAGGNITTGGSNIAIGYSSLQGNAVTGTHNIGLGDAAGYNLTSGGNNILIGKNAGRDTSTTDSLAQVDSGSNQIHIGNKTHTDAKVNISWTIVSDKRDKTNIEELDKGLAFVENLKPVSYERRKNRESEETDGKERYGFLAQDVLELEGDKPVIVNNEDLENLTLTSDYIVPILVNAIKELKQEIEILKSK